MEKIYASLGSVIRCYDFAVDALFLKLVCEFPYLVVSRFTMVSPGDLGSTRVAQYARAL